MRAILLTCAIAVLQGFVSAQPVVLADSTVAFTFASDQIVKPNGEVLYKVAGNIVFSGDSRDNEDIAFLIRSEDLFAREYGHVFDASLTQTLYTFRKGRVYVGDEAAYEKLIARVVREQEHVAVYDVDDRLLASWLRTNQTSSNAVVIALTVSVIEHIGADSLVNSGAQLQDGIVGIMYPYWNAHFYDEWIWDGQILQPRYGYRSEDVWQFDGKYIKPKWSHTYAEEWEWNGEILEPAWPVGGNHTFIWDGYSIRPFWDFRADAEWVIEDDRVRQKWSNDHRQEWVIEGEMPVPLVFLIVTGIADR